MFVIYFVDGHPHSHIVVIPVLFIEVDASRLCTLYFANFVNTLSPLKYLLLFSNPIKSIFHCSKGINFFSFVNPVSLQLYRRLSYLVGSELYESRIFCFSLGVILLTFTWEVVSLCSSKYIKSKCDGLSHEDDVDDVEFLCEEDDDELDVLLGDEDEE